MDLDCPDALSAGDPLRSYIPPGTQIKEHRDGIEVQEPGRPDVLQYRRTSVSSSQSFEVDHGKAYIQDIVITGEVHSSYPCLQTMSYLCLCQGHSSWGQFNLVGRVRPGDGFISLSKEYV
jgi:hypothetical protein